LPFDELKTFRQRLRDLKGVLGVAPIAGCASEPNDRSHLPRRLQEVNGARNSNQLVAIRQ
jgi:hypothetical protein